MGKLLSVTTVLNKPKNELKFDDYFSLIDLVWKDLIDDVRDEKPAIITFSKQSLYKIFYRSFQPFR